MTTNNRWNITLDEGSKMALGIIKKILNEQKNLSMDSAELTLLINNRSSQFNITNNRKKRSLMNFINSNYGNLINFVDNYEELVIFINGKKNRIKLNDENVSLFSEWICVN